MLGWFRRDPVAKLRAEYVRLLERARDLQRSGDIVGFAAMTSRAAELAKRIEAIEAGRR